MRVGGVEWGALPRRRLERVVLQLGLLAAARCPVVFDAGALQRLLLDVLAALPEEARGAA